MDRYKVKNTSVNDILNFTLCTHNVRNLYINDGDVDVILLIYRFAEYVFDAQIRKVVNTGSISVSYNFSDYDYTVIYQGLIGVDFKLVVKPDKNIYYEIIEEDKTGTILIENDDLPIEDEAIVISNFFFQTEKEIGNLNNKKYYVVTSKDKLLELNNNKYTSRIIEGIYEKLVTDNKKHYKQKNIVYKWATIFNKLTIIWSMNNSIKILVVDKVPLTVISIDIDSTLNSIFIDLVEETKKGKVIILYSFLRGNKPIESRTTIKLE
jgi:hypothetical protein